MKNELKIDLLTVKSQKSCNPTSAFCFGEERQQITDAQPMASSKNIFFISSSRA